MTGEWFGPAFGAHYRVLYAHRDEAEAARALDRLARLAPFSAGGRTRILDLGCGDGRHLAPLVEGGVSAVGLDLSGPLLAAARRRKPGGEPLGLVRGDMRFLPFGDRSFTAVLSLFTAFGYFSTRESNMLPVKEISRIMVDGGHWFLDYLDGDAVRAELGDGRPRTRVREAGPLAVSETRRFDRAAGRVEKGVRIDPLPGRESEAAALDIGPGGLDYLESVAVFTLAELDSMARAAGLERVAEAGGYQDEELGAGNRWILVYRRNHGSEVSA